MQEILQSSQWCSNFCPNWLLCYNDLFFNIKRTGVLFFLKKTVREPPGPRSILQLKISVCLACEQALLGVLGAGGRKEERKSL